MIAFEKLNNIKENYLIAFKTARVHYIISTCTPCFNVFMQLVKSMHKQNYFMQKYKTKALNYTT